MSMRWIAFAAAVSAAVMDLMDSTIAQVAAPAIRDELGGSYATIEWITAAYALAMAVALITGGRLGDIFGRKRMLMIGIGGFVGASILCAFAQTPGELIAARAAQGAVGAIMLPQVLGLIGDLFEPQEMGKAFTVYGPVMGLAAMLGPIVGGGLVDADVLGLGWRMIFLVNIPVGIAALAIGGRLLPEGRTADAADTRLDLRGMALVGTAMFLLVYPLVQGRQLGWPLWIVAMLVASVPMLALFARQQVRRQRGGRAPLIEPGIFRRRAYNAGVVFSLVFLGALGGVVLVFNVLLQVGLGFSPWHSATITSCWALGGFFGAAAGGIAMAKLGRRVLQAGLVVEAVGLLAVYATLRAAGTGVETIDLVAPMVVGGVGMGMVFVPLFDIVLAGVAPHEVGSASGVLQSVNGLGMSLGVATLGALFFALVDGAGGGHAHAFVASGQWAVLATVGLLAVALVVSFWLPARAREAAPQASSDARPVSALAQAA